MPDYRPERSNGFGSPQIVAIARNMLNQEMPGGPRACALEPTADGARMKVRSRQRTALVVRST
ncbi:hypothetical protein NB311A_06513 [Nitrobacter sp. Nb-311A]|nr:hypothetical protein NB311A_06513 [Nitrobacter sp. Nb-311A]